MRKLDLSKPPESDRIIGFTIPKGGSFYICDHDEVWKISIGKTLGIEVTGHSPYEFVERNTDFLGLVFEGLTANIPLLRVGGNEVAYYFEPRSDFVTINYKVNGRRGQIKFRTLSGDWFAASLSDDGRHLVLAELTTLPFTNWASGRSWYSFLVRIRSSETPVRVRCVAEDLGIKLPEPRLAQASEVPPWERFGEPSASDEAVPAWGTVRQPVLRAKLCTPG